MEEHILLENVFFLSQEKGYKAEGKGEFTNNVLLIYLNIIWHWQAPGSKPDSKKKGRSASAKVEHDEEILSDDSEVEGNPDAGYESEDDNETAEQKRLRLAKKYLEEIEREGKSELK